MLHAGTYTRTEYRKQLLLLDPLLDVGLLSSIFSSPCHIFVGPNIRDRNHIYLSLFALHFKDSTAVILVGSRTLIC
jgi:hypothetical protein